MDIQGDTHRQSMLRVLLRLLTPQGWRTLLRSLRPPGSLGIKLFCLEGVPAAFLLTNVAATAIWTVGGLCALADHSQCHPVTGSTRTLSCASSLGGSGAQCCCITVGFQCHFEPSIRSVDREGGDGAVNL
ncbi:DUF2837 family protein [bacterium]|nr:DUF2837 family protein [bacterium]